MLLALVCLVQVLFSCSCGRSRYEGFNILLISIDTLRADHLGSYGYPRGTSPFIDKLSKEGILFQSHYSQAPTTAASHMTIFTSLYPSVHKMRNWDDNKNAPANVSLSHQIRTIAEILNDAGYKNYSYNGGGNVSHLFGFDRGFRFYRENAEYEVLDWLTTPPEQPFFLFFHTYQPHDPYTPFKPLDRLFDPRYEGKIISTSEEMGNVFHPSKDANADNFFQKRNKFWASVNVKDLGREIFHLKSLYDAEILITDLFLNRLFKRLKELGLYEKTIIIFLSDHGEEFYEHRGFLHERLYRETLHVPCIMRLPGYKPSVIQKVSRNIDIMPTLLELLEIEPPEYIQGESMVRRLKGKDKKSIPVFSESQDKRRSKSLQIDDEYKIILNENSIKPDGAPLYKNLPPLELYDIGEDIGEQVNIIHEKKHDKITTSMIKRLELFMEENQKLANFSGGKSIEYDKETKEKLRSLGYIN